MYFVYSCNGTILPCTSNVQSKVCSSVNVVDISTNPKPYGSPVSVDITITVVEVIDVDEEKETITLSLEIILEWNDTRLYVNQAKEDVEK